jgi:hypothetical protein
VTGARQALCESGEELSIRRVTWAVRDPTSHSRTSHLTRSAFVLHARLAQFAQRPRVRAAIDEAMVVLLREQAL